MDTLVLPSLFMNFFFDGEETCLDTCHLENIETSLPLKMGNKKAPPPRMPQIEERALVRASFLDCLLK